jgi:hypothetical protein
MNEQSGVKTFRLPRLILDNGSLQTLSANALRLFIAISYRFYRARFPQIKYNHRELYLELNMLKKEINDAALELWAAGIMCYQQEKNLITFHLLQPDGSKAKSYLHDPVEPVLKQN